MTLDDDIDLMLADAGNIFTSAGIDQPCELHISDEVVGGSADYPGQVMGMYYALVRASAFTELKPNDDVRVNGTNYRATEVRRVQDGRMLQVMLGTPESED